jgi:hypothetical protein
MNDNSNDNSLGTTQQADRPRNAKSHQPSCVCTLCRRIQARIAAGKPTKEAERAMAKAQRQAKAKSNATTPSNLRERRLVKDAALTAAVAAQAANGLKPNIAQAARIAGMDPSQAQRKIGSDESVLAALARVGITPEVLDSVGAAGLNANETRLITKDGEVLDAIEVPDWHARHKFLRDFYLMIGRLGRDSETQAPGGLIVIASNFVQAVTGHASSCACDECTRVWEEKAREYMESHKRGRNFDDIPD